MHLGKYITELIKSQGREKIWVAAQTKVRYRTLLYRLERDGLLAKDLLKISKLINIDLNELKEKF